MTSLVVDLGGAQLAVGIGEFTADVAVADDDAAAVVLNDNRVDLVCLCHKSGWTSHSASPDLRIIHYNQLIRRGLQYSFCKLHNYFWVKCSSCTKGAWKEKGLSTMLSMIDRMRKVTICRPVRPKKIADFRRAEGLRMDRGSPVSAPPLPVQGTPYERRQHKP